MDGMETYIIAATIYGFMEYHSALTITGLFPIYQR